MISPRFFFYDEFTRFEDLILRHGGKKKIFRKNSILYKANTIPWNSYLITDGIARLSLINKKGKEHCLFMMGKGSVYPINCTRDSFTTDRYTSFTAVTDLEVIAFPTVAILQCIEESPDFSIACINHHCRYENVLMAKMLMDTYRDSTQVICTFLYLYILHKPVKDAVVDLSQDEIGKMVGISRNQVIRVINDLRANRIIQTAQKKIKIVDLSGLEEYCSDIIHS